MKILTLMLLAVILSAKYSHSQTATIGDKSFAITLFIGSEHDSRDTLMFGNNSFQFATAKKYGFVTQSIKVKDKNAYTAFTIVCKSKKNGDMIWDGKMMTDSIAGTLIWDQPLQNPMNYTFTGKQVEE